MSIEISDTYNFMIAGTSGISLVPSPSFFARREAPFQRQKRGTGDEATQVYLDLDISEPKMSTSTTHAHNDCIIKEGGANNS